MYKVVLFNLDLIGGAGKFIITLAQALQEFNVKTHIILLKEEIEYPLPSKIELHILKSESSNKRLIAKALKRRLEEIGKIDIIFSNSTPSNWILSYLNLPNAYHIVHSVESKKYHGVSGALKNTLRKIKYRRLYNAKRLITVSEGLRHYILEDLKAKPQSIQTIYNPFDIRTIRTLSKESLPEIPKEAYLVHIGRLDISQKRHDLLLEAYKKASTPYKLYIVGEGEDRYKIKDMINQMGLSNSVILHGYSKNPYAWMRRAKLLILSSDFEGYGRVLTEALIVGTPAISTDCLSGPSEILTGSLKEYLSPPGDANALAANISKALREYPDISKLDFSYLRSEHISRAYLELIKSARDKEAKNV